MTGDYVYAGNVVFRELLQDADGTLATRFVPEMMPPPGDTFPRQDRAISVEAGETVGVTAIPETPVDGLFSVTITPEAGTEEYGLRLRMDEQGEGGYHLSFTPHHDQVARSRRRGGTVIPWLPPTWRGSGRGSM